MKLETRGITFQMPQYSLTGDIMSYRTCGLQYRYYNGSSLPPSRPVQLWTGEFIHGMMESAYQYWSKNTQTTTFPFPYTIVDPNRDIDLSTLAENDLAVLGNTVESRLRNSGMTHKSLDARRAAYDRVNSTLRVIAPHLFPLIEFTEIKIRGTRPLTIPEPIQGQSARSERYELTGVADVITHVSVGKHPDNILVSKLSEHIDTLSDKFEIVVDYKGAGRPEKDSSRWVDQDWQIQTYAWLRDKQPNSIPVRAGIIIYINELQPNASDMADLKRCIQQGSTDISVKEGSSDYHKILRWTNGMPTPDLSEEFLINRAIRIIPVTDDTMNVAVANIDAIVGDIEVHALQENVTGDILINWPTTGGENECVACDFKNFCLKRSSISRFPKAPG